MDECIHRLGIQPLTLIHPLCCVLFLLCVGEIVLGVFGHGGCIRTMLNSYCGIHDQWTWLVMQDNTAMNEILIDARGTATIRINDSAHLKYSMEPPALLAPNSPRGDKATSTQPTLSVESSTCTDTPSLTMPASPKRPKSPSSKGTK